MRDIFLTVTEAAQNFADCVNRAHYQQQSFVLLKNGVPFARLVPAAPVVCRGLDLVRALEGADLSDAEARAWRRDRQTARKLLKPPHEKW